LIVQLLNLLRFYLQVLHLDEACSDNIGQGSHLFTHFSRHSSPLYLAKKLVLDFNSTLVQLLAIWKFTEPLI
jgi:hypothetical protein